LRAQLNELGLQQLKSSEPVDINQVVREVVRDPQAALFGAWTCALDLVEGGAWVVTQPESFYRNLLRSIRDLRKSVPNGSISISTRVHGDEVVLRIRDHAQSGRYGAVNRFFDPDRFPTTRSRGSSGLTLALLNHYMAQTGGSVECTRDDPDENVMLALRFPHAATDEKCSFAAAASA
jgi:C4-dicarboxylate-specific signal transduction histidine kinase